MNDMHIKISVNKCKRYASNILTVNNKNKYIKKIN